MHFGQAVFQQFQKLQKRILIWGYLVLSLQCAYSDMVGDKKLMLTAADTDKKFHKQKWGKTTTKAAIGVGHRWPS